MISSEKSGVIKYFLITAAILIIVRALIFSPVEVDGASMYPTLADEDKIIINKLSDYERFDIIVFKGKNNKVYVKRIIGIEGDHIAFKQDQLLINGETVEEPYLTSLKQTMITDKLTGSFNLEELYGFDTIPAGHYFVLGDNRLDSLDSRHPYIISLVKHDQIFGEAELIYYPFKHAKWIK